ncbi:MAG: C4-type zinc ribbon domain-containing protein [Treponema sp.]|jgi:predicted  nucleic acid-binding Zn-ribbon protein|nr:C4-type zinc ribbon domain-containing protein [Treponema sp.]
MVTENELDKLRTLQNILTEKIQLEHEIQEIPKQLGALEEAYNRTRKSFIEKNVEQEKVKTAEEDARVILSEAEAAREKAERTISEINTQREYEALDKERHAAEEKEQQYRKEVQQKERHLLELDEQIKQHAALIEQQENELAEKRAGIEADVAEKKKQVDALLKKERNLTDNLDSEVVFKFERIIRNKMGLGIVAIKGNVCMGCHMILPAQFSNNVRLGEEFVFCPYCSRILYYEESSDGEELFFDAEDSGALYDPEEMEEEEFEEEDDKEEEKVVNIDYEEG